MPLLSTNPTTSDLLSRSREKGVVHSHVGLGSILDQLCSALDINDSQSQLFEAHETSAKDQREGSWPCVILQ